VRGTVQFRFLPPVFPTLVCPQNPFEQKGGFQTGKPPPHNREQPTHNTTRTKQNNVGSLRDLLKVGYTSFAESTPGIVTNRRFPSWQTTGRRGKTAAMKPTRFVVAAAQMKFSPGVKSNVHWICTQIREAAEHRTDAILFPECAVTGYHCDFRTISKTEVESALVTIAQAARESACNVLVGCPTWNGRLKLNSLLVFNRQGREIHRYSKIHLTPGDRRYFSPGNSLAYFHLDGIACTAMICHERRFPELVRLPVMLGAQIVFHPNAGLDALEVSKRKRGGRDGIAVRAFENAVYYVFANSVGPQGDGLWSAGDSKIVAPDSCVLALANNRDGAVVRAELDLSLATRKYAREALVQPSFLRKQWRTLLRECRRQLSMGNST
jgi:predicted amidohydrolase